MTVGETDRPIVSAPPAAPVLRRPDRQDAAAIHRLVAECPPLDLNSVYAYLLLCEHFRDTCVAACRGARIDGFISAYIPPGRPDTLFVWQVAVHERARGQSLGKAMLRELLARPMARHVRHLETTVGPTNQASRRMFAGLARELGTCSIEEPLFDRTLFGAGEHEDEMLLKIGPFGERPSAA